ncbi:branched-chain amino acid ABC transporter permease [Rugamonas rubra]|uniref:Branched-chain amino acid transport system permease protein n=1 Tax=Rugamonas rubra TaxID=758825 RepID=A0A1I4J0E1_9BURK|nr:branched-chain amino acid ABC transporter permease [Rugamonas rubra]SFL59486.1 branched-chain amino acid transport system permease protein [Rugamonas rubra]
MRRARPALAWAAGLAAVYGAVPLLLGADHYVMSLLVAALVVAAVAQSWALLGNLGGMVSFGHSAFFGVGAYASALATARLGVPVAAGLAIGAGAALLAAALMLPLLRLRGPYFALAVLACAQILRILATEWRGLTGGAGGLANIAPLPALLGQAAGGKLAAYLLIASIVLLFALGYARLRASHYGLALRAMHDGEDATGVLGVDTTLLKGLMLLLSGAMCGLAGAFNAHYIGFLEPDYAFAAAWVTLPVVAAILGGYRGVAGPVLGALAVYLLDQLLFKALLPSGHQLVLGALLVATILRSPAGLLPPLAGWWRRRRRPAGDEHA